MDVARSINEIDLSDSESFHLLLNFLEKYPSESFRLYQYFKYIKQNLVKKEYLQTYQLFVNDRENIKCILFIRCDIDFKWNYEILNEEKKFDKRLVTFFCDEENDQLLMNLIENYLPWTKIKNFLFFFIQQRFSIFIQNFVHHNHLGQCEVRSYQQMELDRTRFINNNFNITSFNLSNNHTFLTDIDIRPLSVSDASIVNDFWIFKSETSLDRIQYEIEHFPSFGAYRNNELLSWTLTKYNGSIGSVFTKPEVRGFGLGTIVNFHLASKLFETQERTFCFVAHNNIASMKMFEKLGYHRVFDVDWVIFTSN